MSNKNWQDVAFLEALRPDPGWEVETAFLATYSADLVVLVACLLALAGLDDDEGKGSKVDFANAYEKLRGKVRFIIQKGRLSFPNKKHAILSIMDRFIREVDFDERQRSWHPKMALVKYRNPTDNNEVWRLWCGGRNFTKDISWDTGLLLNGSKEKKGKILDGIPEASLVLSKLASLPKISPEKIKRKINKIFWEAPAGVSVEKFCLTGFKDSFPLPHEPEGLDRLLVISPFINESIIGKLGRWGSDKTERVVLSILPQLSQLSKETLSYYNHILFLTKSEIEPNAEDRDEVQFENMGLHAKIIYAEHQNNRSLWMGSANATRRGWCGTNAEVIVKLSVDPNLVKGIDALKDSATICETQNLENLKIENDVDEALENARKEVVAKWDVVQNITKNGPVLTAKTVPLPTNKSIKMEVGNLNSLYIPWPIRKRVLSLPKIEDHEVGELIKIKLTFMDKERHWLLRAPLELSPDESRDRKAIARYLDPRTFLQWIRALLTGDLQGDGGGKWDEDSERSKNSALRQAGPTWWAPTLEELLTAWSRDPNLLKEIDRKISRYFNLISFSEENYSKEDQLALEEFREAWKIVSKELM